RQQREEAADVDRERAHAGEQVTHQPHVAEAGEQGGHRMPHAALRPRAATRCGTSRTEASAAAWSAVTGALAGAPRSTSDLRSPSSPVSWYSASSLTHQVS